MSLIVTTEDLKNYVSVSIGLEIETLNPYLEQVERDYLKPLIGTDTYDQIAAGTSSSGGDINELTKITKLAVADLALWKWTDSIGPVSISSKGIQRIESSSMKSAYKYQEVAVIEAFKIGGFNGLDAILEYLEANIDKYPDFENSENYTVFKQYFIRSATDFNKYFFINSSRLVFLKVQSFIQQVEDFDILQLIGQELFDEAKAEYQLNDYTGKNEELVAHIQKAIPPMTIYRGLTELHFNIADKRLFFVSSYSDASREQRSAVSLNDLQAMARSAQKTAQAYLETIRKYLADNIDDFPLYEDSDAYNEDDSPGPYARDNDDKKTYWTG